MMDSDLRTRIRNLPDTVALEAAQLYTLELGVTDTTPPPAAAEDPLLTAPEQNLDELVQLARVLLLSGADDDPDAVLRSIEGAGQAQFVLGGMEIVILAGLLVAAAELVLTRGRKSVKKVTKKVKKPDGTETTTTTDETTYGFSLLPKLASLFAKLASD